MTAAQSARIYEILGKHFNNSEDAKTVVTEIEEIIDNKIEAKAAFYLLKMISWS